MKDLHCHLLPGLDDGSQSLSETEEMLVSASGSGITTIAATSHYSPEMDLRYEDTWKAVCELAAKYSIRLLKGTEYDLEYLADIPPEKLRPIGDTKLLLVDMNRNYIIHSMVNLFFKLELAGFQIIFAHPERMLPRESLKKLLNLLEENGIFIQLDTGSIVGRYGNLAKSNAFFILDHGGCHLLGNDAHKAKHFLFRECRDILDRRYGQGLFELLAERNPAEILAGNDPWPSLKRKSFWDRLLRRDT